jgi:hypothetical protein
LEAYKGYIENKIPLELKLNVRLPISRENWNTESMSTISRENWNTESMSTQIIGESVG